MRRETIVIFATIRMKRPNPSFLSALAAAVLVTGCAGDKDRYPSLAIRDVERTAGQFTPTEPEELTPIRPVASAGDIAPSSRTEDSFKRVPGLPTS